MIGIISEQHEDRLIEEFFQLFKTPWEFFNENKIYDVVIVTGNTPSAINSNVIIIFNPCNEKSLKIDTYNKKGLRGYKYIHWEDIKLPIYGNLYQVKGKGQTFLKDEDKCITVGLKRENGSQKVFKIGYDLFDEVKYMLTMGQPEENAYIPTIDLHISILRSLILKSGIPIIEIPPIPYGYELIACLTHDVDFVKIGDHKFDHSLFGFIYRATCGSLINYLNNRIPLRYLLKNLRAFFKLPSIFMKLSKDIWDQFDRYMLIEKGINSTYFFIPFKNHPGIYPGYCQSKKRATKYDISDVISTVNKLIDRGDEIALHGIDAWHSQKLAKNELQRIKDATGVNCNGVRMHWLCFSSESFKILDSTGFNYDSTYGYNDAIGFKAGTSQAFQPLVAKQLMEIPIIIQDNPLFKENGKRLSDEMVCKKCNRIIKTIKSYGGTLTIIWHQRSLAPERLYDEFYIELLKNLNGCYNTWFATGQQVFEWFKKRRDFDFKNIRVSKRKVEVGERTFQDDRIPSIMLRVYGCRPSGRSGEIVSDYHSTYKDIALAGVIKEDGIG